MSCHCEERSRACPEERSDVGMAIQWSRNSFSVFFILVILSNFFWIATSPAEARNDAIQVNIGILEDINRAYITANEDYEVIEDRSTDQGSFVDSIVLLERNDGKEVLLRSSPGTLNDLVVASAPELNSTNSNLLFKCKKEDCVFTIKQFQGDKNLYSKFKGEIIIKPAEKTFTVINKLELEEYLRGVVPGEMPISWDLEALKAQAVAARTYTLKNLERRKALGYDLKASVEDQMYKGIRAADPRTDKAIKETKGEFLKDKQGLVVDAYYSSHAGKFTAYPEDGWGLSPKHYLIAVKEVGNDYTWQSKFSVFDLSQKLSDLGIGKIQAVTLVETSPEARARRILVSGVKGDRLLTGEEFRHQLGLKSTLFTLKNIGQSLEIKGHGFGHGIGMSQHGAKYLAEQGLGYKEILARYYSDTVIARSRATRQSP